VVVVVVVIVGLPLVVPVEVDPEQVETWPPEQEQ